MDGYRYYVEWIDEGNETELTEEALRRRLDGNVVDIDLAIADLESNPGEPQRLTAFAFYRAERS